MIQKYTCFAIYDRLTGVLVEGGFSSRSAAYDYLDREYGGDRIRYAVRVQL